MGQHPNPDPNKDKEDVEELGTPFYTKATACQSGP
jgi:hypothetical protein